MRIITQLRKVLRVLSTLLDLPEKLEDLQQSIARVELRQLSEVKSLAIQDFEFKSSSQNGEDGIIQFLINHVPIANKVFVEFGVHDYQESNTRFLLKNNNWTGLVIDGSSRNVEFIKTDPLYWRFNLKAECSFVTKENIDSLIRRNGIRGDIGILSVDIDGNDYWVWEAIECISPRIVICEYNGLFGPTAALSTPYDKDFVYHKAHYSTLYWGASIAAFTHLASQKGYSLVGSNTNGNNVFFVRNDVVGSIPVMTPERAYVTSSFRTSRDRQGNLTFLDQKSCFDLVSELPLIDVKTGNLVTLREILIEFA
jgi:hypothetical protein